MDTSVHRGLVCAIVSLLERHPVPEEYLKLGMYLRPILTLARPLPCDVHSGKVEHLEKNIVIGENSLVLRHFSQLPIETFNGVGGVDESPDLLRILEIGRKLRPVRQDLDILGYFESHFPANSSSA